LKIARFIKNAFIIWVSAHHSRQQEVFAFCVRQKSYSFTSKNSFI
jgi:hypothetical protein